MDRMPWVTAGSCSPLPPASPRQQQRGPYPLQCPPRLPLQLVRADPQHRIAEAGKEDSALLLAVAVVRLRDELHDQRTLRANVRNDERADLAAGVEAEGAK
jgi:hypothetical protein